MKPAEKEEKQFAMEQNSYHQGIPAITVIVDGGQSKLTYKYSYNALSSVGVIFREHTGKLLYIGVRYKPCAFCVHYNKVQQVDILISKNQALQILYLTHRVYNETTY